MTERLLKKARSAKTPEARALAAHVPLEALELAVVLLSAERKLAVAELRRAGWSWQEIADLLGIHRNRAAHLLDP